MKTTILLAALLCGCADPGRSGNAGGPDIPEDQRTVRVGFGAYAGPCDNTSAFVEHARVPDQLGSIASQRIRFGFAGTVVRATVVHAVGGPAACGPDERTVLVSAPTFDAVPHTPGLREVLRWSEEEVEGAPAYDMPGVEHAAVKALGRDLAEPFHVRRQQSVFLGSLLQAGDECVVGCGGTLPDGSEPPRGDAFCAVGESWEGCGVPPPGDFYLAYVGWLDVVPD